ASAFTIEMPKLLKAWKEEKLNPWNDILARWLLLLGMVDHRNNKYYEDIYRELEVIAMDDKTLRKAFHQWEELSMTPEQFLAYESRLKHIMDVEAAKREAELRAQEAEKEGMERGMKRGIEQGKKTGKKIGEQIDREIGEKEEERKTKELIKQSLLAKGEDDKQIMEIIDMTKKKVLKIQQNMKK